MLDDIAGSRTTDNRAVNVEAEAGRLLAIQVEPSLMPGACGDIQPIKPAVDAQKVGIFFAEKIGDPPWTPSFLRRNEVMLRIDQ